MNTSYQRDECKARAQKQRSADFFAGQLGGFRCRRSAAVIWV